MHLIFFHSRFFVWLLSCLTRIRLRALISLCHDFFLFYRKNWCSPIPVFKDPAQRERSSREKSRSHLTVKCHFLILIKSSKVNSMVSRPSVQTLVKVRFPWWVVIVVWSQSAGKKDGETKSISFKLKLASEKSNSSKIWVKLKFWKISSCYSHLYRQIRTAFTERDGGVVKWFSGMFESKVKVGDATLKNRPEVTWN